LDSWSLLHRLCQCVVRAYEQGHRTVAEVAEQFSVSAGFVKKMPQQMHLTASADAMKNIFIASAPALIYCLRNTLIALARMLFHMLGA
jgi:hypothetical protein